MTSVIYVTLRFIRLITTLRENFFLLETAFENNLYFYKKFSKINIQINCMSLFIKSRIYDKKRKIRINKVK